MALVNSLRDMMFSPMSVSLAEAEATSEALQGRRATFAAKKDRIAREACPLPSQGLQSSPALA